MFPGPVFSVELLTTARRPRYYALRSFYGLVLLVIFWGSYGAFEAGTGGRTHFLPGEMAAFARGTFVWFAVAQGVAVLAITPALVGGTIAGEKQRKTLHYLLTSELSSPEIVLGKLLARMLMLFVYLVAGVPLLFLLTLFGGVEIELILMTFLVTGTFAFFLASVSIFFSTFLRQARSAITMAYLAMVGCALSPLVAEMAALLFPEWLGWLGDAVYWANPLVNVFEISRLVSTGFIQTSLWRMVAIQWTYAILLLVVATRSLRKVAANESARPKTLLRLDRRGRPRWRALPRPPIGNDPMMWKERHTARIGGVAKMLGLLNNLFWAVLIGCLTFEYARTAFSELFAYGFGGREGSANRAEFNAILRYITPWVAGFWILGTTTTAASSIASEREDDTWISLVATDLEGNEILRAKLLGSILRFRWMGIMLLTIWTIGVLGGAVHPLGFLAACVELGVFLWFAAILGLRYSLLSGSTSKALALSLGTLLFCNVGYLLCCIPIPPPLGNSLACVFGVMPYLMLDSLFTGEGLHRFSSLVGEIDDIRYWITHPIAPALLGVAFYGLAAAVLTWRTFARFDEVVDRPTLAEGS